MERYDKANPDPRYHAAWSRRYARRAIVASYLAIFLGLVSIGLSIVASV